MFMCSMCGCGVGVVWRLCGVKKLCVYSISVCVFSVFSVCVFSVCV